LNGIDLVSFEIEIFFFKERVSGFSKPLSSVNTHYNYRNKNIDKTHIFFR
jgi:hypothetical protein